MKDGRAIIPFILLVLLSVGGGAHYYFFVTKEEYPIVKEIENLDGKIIEAKLIGKSGGFLFIESPPDGKHFEIPTYKLSLKDRILCRRLREKIPESLEIPEEKEAEDPYITLRKAKISEIQERIRVTKSEIESNSLSETLRSKRITEIKEYEKDIRELEVAIET